MRLQGFARFATASLGALVSAAVRVRTLCCGFSACVFALVLNIISIILSMLYGKEKESVMMPAWGLFRENGTFAHKTAAPPWGLFRENGTFAHKTIAAAKHRQQNSPAGWRVCALTALLGIVKVLPTGTS